jgi:Arc/MetJ family transcription regulator
MRLHIEIDDELIAEVDRLTGPRQRSQFVREAVKGALERRRRWELIRRSRGVIASHGHEWDDDPAAWVHAQRFSDPRFKG